MTQETKQPTPSKTYTKARDRMRNQEYESISDYAEDLIKISHHKDEDGRDIGLDYDQIRDAVVKRFPRVLTPGPHKGRKTRMSVKEIIAKACRMNQLGVKLPFRPRRKSERKKDGPKKDSRA